MKFKCEHVSPDNQYTTGGFVPPSVLAGGKNTDIVILVPVAVESCSYTFVKPPKVFWDLTKFSDMVLLLELKNLLSIVCLTAVVDKRDKSIHDVVNGTSLSPRFE